MAWEVELTTDADLELQEFRVFVQRRIASAIVAHLTTSPDVETRNKICLGDQITANFDYVPPLWELRVGAYRVFYENDSQEKPVYVHAVRHKPPDRTTAEVLDQTNRD